MYSRSLAEVSLVQKLEGDDEEEKQVSTTMSASSSIQPLKVLT